MKPIILLLLFLYTGSALGQSLPPVHSVLIAPSPGTFGFKGTLGTNGQVIIGTTNADPVFKTMSGDCGLAASGVVTCTVPSSRVTYTPAGTGGLQTTVNAELQRSSVSPLDFGAVCNGSTDDTAALQKAYDSVKGTGVPVILPIATCVISGALTLDTAESVLRGQGPGSIIKTTSVAADAILVSAGDQTVSDLTVMSAVGASRTGAGIHTTTGAIGIHLLRLLSYGHGKGFWITSPAVDFGYSVSQSNNVDGVVYDNTTGGLNINESQLVEVQSNGNGQSGFNFICGTANHGFGIFLVRPTAAFNTLDGITFTGGAGTTTSCADIGIDQPEMSTNGSRNINTVLNPNGINLTVTGGFLEGAAGTCNLCIYMNNTVATGTLVTTAQQNGVLVESGWVSLTGLVIGGGSSVSALRLGATSSHVVISGVQTSPVNGIANAIGLQIDVGAGAFVCGSSDFTQATTPRVGAVPGGSITTPCLGL